MMFVKKEENLFPFRSRSDNEPGAGKQGELRICLYEIYSSVVSDREAAGASVAKEKADDIANAKLLRNASLGMLTENEKATMRQRKKRKSANCGVESITSNTSSSCGTPSEASSAKRFQPSSDVQHFVDLSSEHMEYHQLHIQSKEEWKKEQQQIKAKQWGLKFEFKKQQAEQANDLQRMQLELQTEMIRFLREQQQQQHSDQDDRTKKNNKQSCSYL